MSDYQKKETDQIHPEQPGAIGSRNSLFRNERDEYQEASVVVDEEVDKILNHIGSKLPPEVLNKLDVMGSIKDKLHNYYNQTVQNMQNRYLVTVEDELVKKYQNLVEEEEQLQLNRYTPKQIGQLIEQLGDADLFTTNREEQSIAQIYEKLQKNLTRSFAELQSQTNEVLNKKDGIGSFIRKNNAYTIAKCSVKNNLEKPKTVLDLKLAVNILDSELITPIYHYQKSAKELLKETVSSHIHSLIDQKIEALNIERSQMGQPQLNQNEIISEKFQELENLIPFDHSSDDPDSGQYEFIAKRFFDSLDDIESNSVTENEQNDLRYHIQNIIEREDIQNQGFDKVVSTLTRILDNSRSSYQYINNYKNARVCVLQEYAPENGEDLPDENFSLRLSYLTYEQIKQLRRAYDIQALEIEGEIDQTARVIEQIQTLHNNKNNKKTKIRTYKDISREILGRFKRTSEDGDEEKPSDDYDLEDNLWYEISFSRPEQNNSNKSTTYSQFSNDLKQKIKLLKQKVFNIFENQHPKERFILEERINFLEDSFQSFSSQVNPHHLQQGLVLEVNIRSIKRKQTTMGLMSNVLNEFIEQVSKNYHMDEQADFSATPANDNDRAFASSLNQMDQKLEELEA